MSNMRLRPPAAPTPRPVRPGALRRYVRADRGWPTAGRGSEVDEMKELLTRSELTRGDVRRFADRAEAEVTFWGASLLKCPHPNFLNFHLSDWPKILRVAALRYKHVSSKVAMTLSRLDRARDKRNPNRSKRSRQRRAPAHYRIVIETRCCFAGTSKSVVSMCLPSFIACGEELSCGERPDWRCHERSRPLPDLSRFRLSCDINTAV